MPVARSLCVHFTTLDGATLSARATFRTLSPAAIRATARFSILRLRSEAMPAAHSTRPAAWTQPFGL